MTTEEILKNIETAIKLNSEAKRNINEALCHAMNAIKNIDKKLKEEYERGTKDAWDLACDICCSAAVGGMTNDQLKLIFGESLSINIMDNYSYERAKAAMEKYEAKKEIEKLAKGDIVNCKRIDSDFQYYESVFLRKTTDHYVVFGKEDTDIHYLKDNIWKLTKTGKHVDLD